MRSLPVLIFVAVLALVSSGCKSKVTKANYDKIVEGMTLKEVENILGEGKQQGDGGGVALQVGVDLSAPGGGGRGQRFVWENDAGGKITLIFEKGAVTKKLESGLK